MRANLPVQRFQNMYKVIRPEKWGKGEIRFGFNLSRVFTLGKKSKANYEDTTAMDR